MSSASGRIANIQNFSLHDGPGIRATVFFKGCPLQCCWCANPEMQKSDIELLHKRSQCIGCGECVNTCPQKLIQLEETITINRNECSLCGACIDTCPGDALCFAGRDMTVMEVMEQIEREKHFFRHSGGGVTLSGGEPLAQAKFSEALLAACRRWGINTAIETCGHASFEVVDRITKLSDTVYFDIKLIDNTVHKKYTGVGNGQIKENLAKLSEAHPNLIVRTPLVPDINTSARELNALGNFLLGHTAITRVELLNYHKLGEYKYTNLGRTYGLEGLMPATHDEFAALAKRFAMQFSALTVSFHT